MSKANNSILMKEQNRAHVLRLIRKNPLSRAEIARQTGLTRAAVSIIVDKLIDEKLIYEGEAVKSAFGRHPVLLHLNNDAFYACGVDITRDGCFITLCNFKGEMVKKIFLGFLENSEATVEAMAQVLKNYKKASGIGVCAPGPLDSEEGIILQPPNFKYFNNFNIKEALEEKLNVPVFLEKDTNALALLEKNLTQKDNFLYLLADHGLGGAFIKDGTLFKGAKGAGCEIGHVTLNVNGQKCSCGNNGCACLYTSVQAIMKKAGKSTYDEVCNSAFNGERISIEALEYQANFLGHALVTFVNLFEPERIILGGEMKKAVYFLKPEIERVLEKHRLSKGKIIIEGSEIIDRASSPAQMVLENYFTKGFL